MNIYFGNLPYRVVGDQVREAFEEYGQVTSCTIIMDKVTGQSKGFGFLEMPDANGAKTAIARLNGRDFHGRPLHVNEVRPREGGGGPRDDREGGRGDR